MARDRTVSAAGLDLQERVVEINRVAKVVKGGRRFSFTALVVVGDEREVVGVGYGKANGVPNAVEKGVKDARKSMFRVPILEGTIPHEIKAEYGASICFLSPASPGTGIIAGASVRAVVEAAGVKNILTKSFGSTNPVNLVKACELALKALRTRRDVERLVEPARRRAERHRHRRAAVEKHYVVARIERRQDARKLALVHGDTVIHAGGRDVFARELHMVRIALDCVDGGVRRAQCEGESSVTERGAELEDAPRIGGSGKRCQQRSIRIRKRAAIVSRPMRIGGVADFRERVRRRGHSS